MTKEKKIQVSSVQREILELMRDGTIMTVQRDGFGWVNDRSIIPDSRFSLRERGLITRIDKTKADTTKGNGYILSDLGLKVLSGLSSRKRVGPRLFRKIFLRFLQVNVKSPTRPTLVSISPRGRRERKSVTSCRARSNMIDPRVTVTDRLRNCSA